MSTNEKKTGNARKLWGHRFVAGTWSAFAAVIVIVIAVVVNLMAGSLPPTTTQIDLTGDSLYSLSDQTKRIAASLDKDVTTGIEDSTIVRLLNNYASLSDHIYAETVDPGLKPTFLKGYELETARLYQNSVIVDSDGRYRLVSYDEITSRIIRWTTVPTAITQLRPSQARTRSRTRSIMFPAIICQKFTR